MNQKIFFVIKDEHGRYAEMINGRNAIFGYTLIDAVLFPEIKYAIGAIQNYEYNAGNPRPSQNFTIVKVISTLEEVDE